MGNFEEVVIATHEAIRRQNKKGCRFGEVTEEVYRYLKQFQNMRVGDVSKEYSDALRVVREYAEACLEPNGVLKEGYKIIDGATKDR